jgi:DNA repair and recombination protein RAD52
MSVTKEQKDMLGGPLMSTFVKTREQGGKSLSYIEAWRAIDHANKVFGFDGWTRETVLMTACNEEPRDIGEKKLPGWDVGYVAKVRITALGVTREGYGFGQGIDRNKGLAHESAVKEAESDAMKRALMTFGNPFGLTLYDKDKADVVDAPVKLVTSEQAEKIRTLAEEVGANWPHYLKYLGVEDIAALPADWYDGAIEALNKKKGSK